MAGRRFVFVDRDGTLIEDRGFVHRIDDYAPLPGAIEGLRELQNAGFEIAVVTNQSGIGRGFLSEADFEATVALAETGGFRSMNNPAIRRSWTVLLSK